MTEMRRSCSGRRSRSSGVLCTADVDEPVVMATKITSDKPWSRSLSGRCWGRAGSSTNPSVPARLRKSPEPLVGRGIGPGAAPVVGIRRRRAGSRSVRGATVTGAASARRSGGLRAGRPSPRRCAGRHSGSGTPASRHGIARQAEHGLPLGPDAEPHRLAGALRHLVEHLAHAEVQEHLRHQVEAAHRDAAAQDHDLVRRSGAARGARAYPSSSGT